jgi:hypothetical protein
MLGVDGTSIGDVVLCCRLLAWSRRCSAYILTCLRINTKALSDLGYPLWSEGALSVCEMRSVWSPI